MADRYVKPFEFRAGNYAKASEVNANFDTLTDFVNELQSDLSLAAISNVAYNKANISGNKEQIFYVANSDETEAAVNNGELIQAVADAKSELEEQIVSPPDYSSGELISANSTIPQNGVLVVTAGTSEYGDYATIRIDGTRFDLLPRQLATFPVAIGTEIGATFNISTMYLYS